MDNIRIPEENKKVHIVLLTGLSLALLSKESMFATFATRHLAVILRIFFLELQRKTLKIALRREGLIPVRLEGQENFLTKTLLTL